MIDYVNTVLGYFGAIITILGVIIIVFQLIRRLFKESASGLDEPTRAPQFVEYFWGTVEKWQGHGFGHAIAQFYLDLLETLNRPLSVVVSTALVVVAFTYFILSSYAAPNAVYSDALFPFYVLASFILALSAFLERLILFHRRDPTYQEYVRILNKDGRRAAQIFAQEKISPLRRKILNFSIKYYSQWLDHMGWIFGFPIIILSTVLYFFTFSEFSASFARADGDAGKSVLAVLAFFLISLHFVLIPVRVVAGILVSTNPEGMGRLAFPDRWDRVSPNLHDQAKTLAIVERFGVHTGVLFSFAATIGVMVLASNAAEEILAYPVSFFVANVLADGLTFIATVVAILFIINRPKYFVAIIAFDLFLAAVFALFAVYLGLLGSPHQVSLYQSFEMLFFIGSQENRYPWSILLAMHTTLIPSAVLWIVIIFAYVSYAISGLLDYVLVRRDGENPSLIHWIKTGFTMVVWGAGLQLEPLDQIPYVLKIFGVADV